MKPDDTETSEDIGALDIVYLFCYIVAFFLFFDINWKLGVGWLLWRIAHAIRTTCEEVDKKTQDNADESTD